MRKILIALGITLCSFLYAAILTIITYFEYNYRVIGNGDDAFLLIVMFICDYYFGVYIIASILFRLSSKQERDIIPSGSIIIPLSFVVSLALITLILFPDILSILVFSVFFLSVILLFKLLVISLAYHFKSNRYNSRTRFPKNIFYALLINLILLAVVCYNGFPGVGAPIEIRQKWAYKTFRHYPAMVSSIKESNEIIDKVGDIKFIAPTKGRNLHTVIGGSSGASSDFTLEVVGDKGTGIAYIETWGGGVMGVCFEYKGKEIVLRGGKDLCQNKIVFLPFL